MALARRSCNLLKPFTAAVSYNPFLRCPISPSSAAVGIETTPNGDGAGTGMAESGVPTLKKVLLNSFQDATQTDLLKNPRPGFIHQCEASLTLHRRCFSGMADQAKSVAQDASVSVTDVAPRIKFKRPDKTARHIMQILDKEAVEEVKGRREIPDIKPGYIIQLKVEVPDNKRRVSILKGIVIARRNAGLNTTFRLRRLVAGVGIESLFPLYSPNIKEVKVLDKKKVRRAKLYYLRDKMNPLKK